MTSGTRVPLEKRGLSSVELLSVRNAQRQPMAVAIGEARSQGIRSSSMWGQNVRHRLAWRASAAIRGASTEKSSASLSQTRLFFEDQTEGPGSKSQGA